MVYLTHYELYPIFEPAEGGYYYEGCSVVQSIKLSKNQAKRRFKRLCEEYKKDEREPWHDDRYGLHISNLSNSECIHVLRCTSKYIGDGEMWVIEKYSGSQTSGWHPYC